MNQPEILRAILVSLCALSFSVSAGAGEVAIYTGATSWIDKGVADAQAQITASRLAAAGVTATTFATAADEAALASWVAARTANGQVDVVILYGYLPVTLYPAGNTMADGSVAELFIESTDGDAIINHADWMFYVTTPCCNGAAALQNIMDAPAIDMGGYDNTLMTVTDQGRAIAPSLGHFLTDRPFHVATLSGEWVVEAALAQSADGMLAEPVILRDGGRGRIVTAYQSADTYYDPKGAVAAEIAAHVMGVGLVPTQLALSGVEVTDAGKAAKLTVSLRDATGAATNAASDVTVSLSDDSATSAFDTARNGSFDGTVTSVTIPGGAASATFFLEDSASGTVALSAAADDVAAASLQVTVVAPRSQGEVVIYTGDVGWTTKGEADAQAQVCVDRLDLMGVANQWYPGTGDQAFGDIAAWVTAATGDGKLDVLVLYGFLPPTLYAPGNGEADGSLIEQFIESTDGDAVINHADWMFYVTTPCCNTEVALQNIMDIPGFTLWDDDLPMVPTDEGKGFTPTLSYFWSDRAFRVDTLINDWFVEAAFAQNGNGTRADPVAVRDGVRGRIIPVFQANNQPDPKGAVAAEIIAWLHGIDITAPSRLGVSGRNLLMAKHPVRFAVQTQSLIGSPAEAAADTTVTLQSSSPSGRFDLDADGSFDGSVTTVTVPAGASSATVFYRDADAGTPTLTASAAGLTNGSLQVTVFPSSHAPAGEVAVYTGKTWWISKALADEQAGICAARLADAGITTTVYDEHADQADLAAWVQARTSNGQLDVLVLYGCLPASLYPTGNTQMDGSIAELFVESPDGDAIINSGDWMFYVDYDAADTRLENGAAGLQSIMDIAGIGMSADNTPVQVTAEGRSIAPTLADFLTDRPFFVNQLAGEWVVEAALAQSADGTVAEPAIVRDGTRGRLVAMYQTLDQNDPKGAVAAEIIAWLMGTELVPTQVALSTTGPSVAVAGLPMKVTVRHGDAGAAMPTDVALAVSLATDSATGAFDAAKDGSFDGAVTTVTIPAGGSSATFYYRDTAAGTVNLTASAEGLAGGTLQATVVEYVPVEPGEVAIYTGNAGWIAKDLADAQAQVSVDALTAAEIPVTWYSSDADKDSVADWVTAATDNGKLDVLVLYGYFPETIYPAGNTSPDGSIAELFIESTDGDAIINHGDWIFYVTTPCCNGGTALENMMDIPGVTVAGYDNTPMIVTAEGAEIAPSLPGFSTDRPLHLSGLADQWFVEASLAQSADGTVADPVIVRDGNRGRVIPALQAQDQNDPKGAVGAEIIQWLMANAVPVEPVTTFRRGDSNADGEMNITDGIFVLNYLFLGGTDPTCIEAADANDDGELNITDGIVILNYLFLGGGAPPAPGPDACGPDPVGSVDLGCTSYTSC